MDADSLTTELLDTMRNVDVRTVDPNTLRDIRDVNIDINLPKQERMMDYLRQIGNPYCYRHGDIVVKVRYLDTDMTLEDALQSYIRKYDR